MTKELRSHVRSAQRERRRDETLIRQVSVKQDYSVRNVKGGGRPRTDDDVPPAHPSALLFSPASR
eukprot:6218927-Pyramimonas_sp.AAC.1